MSRKIKLEVTSTERLLIVAALFAYALNSQEKNSDLEWCHQLANYVATCDPANDGPEVKLLRSQ